MQRGGPPLHVVKQGRTVRGRPCPPPARVQAVAREDIARPRPEPAGYRRQSQKGAGHQQGPHHSFKEAGRRHCPVGLAASIGRPGSDTRNGRYEIVASFAGVTEIGFECRYGLIAGLGGQVAEALQPPQTVCQAWRPGRRGTSAAADRVSGLASRSQRHSRLSSGCCFNRRWSTHQGSCSSTSSRLRSTSPVPRPGTPR